MFPAYMLTPVSKVVEVVLLILDAESEIEGHSNVGQTVEICGLEHHFRGQIDFCDATMQAVMDAGGSDGK